MRRNAEDNAAYFTKSMGRAPTPAELYLMHQQGIAGGPALLKADPRWLERLVSREVPLDQWEKALVREPDDVKPIVVFAAS